MNDCDSFEGFENGFEDFEDFESGFVGLTVISNCAIL